MSKKHFILLADYIRAAQMRGKRENGSYTSEYFSPAQLQQLASFCQEANPRFNRERWLAYIAGECGPKGGTRKAQAVSR